MLARYLFGGTMINRAQAAYYLNGQYSSLAAAVGQDTDPPTGYAYDIDSALRALGLAESDLELATVEDGQRDLFYALCEYYAARRFWRQLSDRADVTMGEESFKFATIIANAKQLMESAAARCGQLGVPVAVSKPFLFEVS
jgi:hypothetical protein